MKIYLAILGFIREPDDAFISDYLVHAESVKQARELVKHESGATHHLYFEIATVPACWTPHVMEVNFDIHNDNIPALPTKWLKGVVESGLLSDILFLEKEDRDALYTFLSTKLHRPDPTLRLPGELFSYGCYELQFHLVDDWENLLRLEAEKLHPEKK